MSKILLGIVFVFGVFQGLTQEISQIERIGISFKDSFKDLKPVGKEIGNFELVILSDWARADDGASYDAMGRLVHYLHSEKGFEVMLWELGVFEGQLMNEAFLNQDVDEGLNTMYKVWRESKSIKSLATYTVNSHQTKIPLEMKGSSCQFHGFGKNNLIEYLTTNKDLLGLTHLSEERKVVLDKLWTEPKRLKELSKADFDRLKKVIEELDVDTSESTHRLLQNMFWFVELEQLRAFTPENKVVEAVQKFRAATTLNNLEWMLENELKGKKVILFGKWPEIQEKYGDRTFSIGITAQSGEVARPGQPPKSLKPTDEEFVESFLSKKGEDYLYLKVDSSLIEYKSRLSSDWTNKYDGIIFLTESYPNEKEVD